MNDLSTLISYSANFLAPNYAPLPVVLSKGQGVWVWDLKGNKYLDCLSAYSATNFGHCNPRIVNKATEQLNKLTLTSRAFLAEELCLLAKDITEFTKTEMCLFMNSGAEAVETAIKAARRWAYKIKGIPSDKAEIITFAGNFHGRTTTIISFSDSVESKDSFGPFTPGFVTVPYGDISAIEKVINANTAAVLIEPIQGEGGVIIPPPGFLKNLAEICRKNNVLLIADEIQTGLCRTGKIFACDHENVIPDLYILGKSLGGGIVPISVVVGKRSILSLLQPGSHGSTFGGNPFACAIAREVLKLIQDEDYSNSSNIQGKYLLDGLNRILKSNKKIKEIRGKGLFVGIELNHEAGKAKKICEQLMHQNILCKDTRDYTIRLLPPLISTRDDIDFILEKINIVFNPAYA